MRITNRKRVLVTGGADFLGLQFCKQLLRDGCDVLCVDSFYSGIKDKVLALLDKPQFELLRHDLTFPLDIEVDETTLSLVGGRSKLVYKPMPHDEPRQRQPDIDLARQHLEQEPTTALLPGLENAIIYFREPLDK